MKLFGLEITRSRRRDLALAEKQYPVLTAVGDRGNWWHRLFVSEPFTGAWQRNIELRTESVVAFSAVYACVTLIASDIGKLRIKLVEQDDEGIWSEVRTVSPYWPVLRKPNAYQNRIKFLEQWVTSKLLYGNTYVLKERDARGIVVAMHILDPTRTTVLQAPNGDIYYRLDRDDLAGVTENRINVPADEIIHDMAVALYHPLVGVSPIHASGIAAAQGLSIQNQSLAFFSNAARPSGILTAPGHIGDDTAARLKADWQNLFTGGNAGKIGVLGDGLTFVPLTMTAEDAQLIEQLKWTAENVCSTFHVPAHMVGVAAPPSYNNIEALNQQYYSQCLQAIIENIELCLDEGLGLTDATPDKTYGTELDLSGLLRMDTATLYETIAKGIGAGLIAPNEGRKLIDLKPVQGGDTPYLQQQNYSLAALDERDKANPLAPKPPAPAPQAGQPGAAPQSAAPPVIGASLDAAAAAQFAAWELRSYLAAA